MCVWFLSLMKDKQKLYQINLFWQNGWAGSRIVSENLISTADQRFGGDKRPFNAPPSAHAHDILLCLFLPLLVNRVKRDAAPNWAERWDMTREVYVTSYSMCHVTGDCIDFEKRLLYLGIFEVSQFAEEIFLWKYLVNYSIMTN